MDSPTTCDKSDSLSVDSDDQNEVEVEIQISPDTLRRFRIQNEM
jgi:hypothetical protein